jgi:hypothetical protein
MNWRIKFALFCVLAIPAFTGFPLNHIAGNLLPGLSLGWMVYALLVHSAVLYILGRSSYRIALVISLIISVPVVCLGAGISFIGLFFRGWSALDLKSILEHYTSLAITMLTVIPLALSIVAVIPFHRIESRMLQKSRGVSLMGKSLLMFARVFNHVIYYVIPDILEVLREERILIQITGRHTSGDAPKQPFQIRARILVRSMIQIGVESICSAVRYVPLWAEEISRLPGKGIANTESDKDDPPIENNRTSQKE